LIGPGSNPDHSDPASWRSSAAAGGSPGGEDATSFDSWAAGFGLLPDDPDLDSDHDGLGLFREYAQGGRPDAALPGEGLFDIAIEELVVDQLTARYVVLSLARNLAADDVEFRIERNVGSLTGQWQDATQEFVLHSDQPLEAGSALLRYRSPLPSDLGQYWRVRFTAK
jgi:hypothetical protein